MKPMDYLQCRDVSLDRQTDISTPIFPTRHQILPLLYDYMWRDLISIIASYAFFARFQEFTLLLPCMPGLLPSWLSVWLYRLLYAVASSLFTGDIKFIREVFLTWAFAFACLTIALCPIQALTLHIFPELGASHAIPCDRRNCFHMPKSVGRGGMNICAMVVAI